MELRRLQASDLFSMVRLLNGIGFKNVKDAVDLKKINEVRNKLKSTELTDEERSKIVSDFGSDVVFSTLTLLIENVPVIEKDLYTFLGSIANMKAKDVAVMDIGEFMNLLVDIAKKEEFKDFFNQASKLIK